LLADVAQRAKHSTVSVKAIESMIDQSKLIEIALTETWISQYAISALSKRNHLLIVVKQVKDDTLRNKARRKLGGYICCLCKNEYIPAYGEKPTCICDLCGAANHDFVHHSTVEKSGGHSESGETWRECTICGEIIDRESVFRYTDW